MGNDQSTEAVAPADPSHGNPPVAQSICPVWPAEEQPYWLRPTVTVTVLKAENLTSDDKTFVKVLVSGQEQHTGKKFGGKWDETFRFPLKPVKNAEGKWGIEEKEIKVLVLEDGFFSDTLLGEATIPLSSGEGVFQLKREEPKPSTPSDADAEKAKATPQGQPPATNEAQTAQPSVDQHKAPTLPDAPKADTPAATPGPSDGKPAAPAPAPAESTPPVQPAAPAKPVTIAIKVSIEGLQHVPAAKLPLYHVLGHPAAPPGQKPAKIPSVGGVIMLELPPQGVVVSAPGTAIAMSSTVSFTTGAGTFNDSVLSSFVHESGLTAVYKATNDGGVLYLAPDNGGTFFILELEGSAQSRWIVAPGAWVFSAGEVRLHRPHDNPKSGCGVDLRAFASSVAKGDTSMEDTGKMGLLLIEGVGLVGLACFGTPQEIHIPDKQKMLIDAAHLVAWPHSMKATVKCVSDERAASQSTEPVFVEFEGPGFLWVQSRTQAAFLPHTDTREVQKARVIGGLYMNAAIGKQAERKQAESKPVEKVAETKPTQAASSSEQPTAEPH